MTSGELVTLEVLRRAAAGELPPATVNPAGLWEACGGDPYAALDAAVALTRARGVVMRRRFVGIRPALRAAA